MNSNPKATCASPDVPDHSAHIQGTATGDAFVSSLERFCFDLLANRIVPHGPACLSLDIERLYGAWCTQQRAIRAGTQHLVGFLRRSPGVRQLRVRWGASKNPASVILFDSHAPPGHGAREWLAEHILRFKAELERMNGAELLVRGES